MNTLLNNLTSFLFNRYVKEDDKNILNMIFISSCISFCAKFSRDVIDKIDFFAIFQFLRGKYNIAPQYANEILIDGTVTKQTSSTNVDFSFSDKLQAVNYFIILNQHNTKMTVCEAVSTSSRSSSKENCYFITEVNSFLLCKKKEIYCTIGLKSSTSEETQNTHIRAKVYSFLATVEEINDFLTEITDQMLKNREDEKQKRVLPIVYTLKPNESRSGGSSAFFTSSNFESTRTFQNMFFDKKQDVLAKIDFFLNNKKWYCDNGIPYSLGIGLHGEPGTGKTSFIKALANYTKRHLVIISLKEIKNKAELEVFFQSKEVGSFDKKIIVFEDIDCIGDLVMAREYKFERAKATTEIAKNPVSSLTLDDILNIFDGILENPGRIMVLTYNHYDKLDPALIRPGRIDLSLHLSNASRECIAEIYNHFYKEPMDAMALAKIPDRFFTPAEVLNTYLLYNNMPEKFIERMQHALKVK